MGIKIYEIHFSNNLIHPFFLKKNFDIARMVFHAHLHQFV